jgi:hypothetical protein
MDFVLPTLLALPFAAAAVIVAVSSVRRRRHARAHGATDAIHRGQADTAAVQSAAIYPPVTGPKVRGGRERRASSAPRSTDG